MLALHNQSPSNGIAYRQSTPYITLCSISMAGFAFRFVLATMFFGVEAHFIVGTWFGWLATYITCCWSIECAVQMLPFTAQKHQIIKHKLHQLICPQIPLLCFTFAFSLCAASARLLTRILSRYIWSYLSWPIAYNYISKLYAIYSDRADLQYRDYSGYGARCLSDLGISHREINCDFEEVWRHWLECFVIVPA